MTFNRGELRRLAQAGKLEMVESYHFDDMTGSSRHEGAAIPVVFSETNRQPNGDYWPDGICVLRPYDFTAKSGRAWFNPDGTITLYLHSNHNVSLRIVGGNKEGGRA